MTFDAVLEVGQLVIWIILAPVLFTADLILIVLDGFTELVELFKRCLAVSAALLLFPTASCLRERDDSIYSAYFDFLEASFLMFSSSAFLLVKVLESIRWVSPQSWLGILALWYFVRRLGADDPADGEPIR